MPEATHPAEPGRLLTEMGYPPERLAPHPLEAAIVTALDTVTPAERAAAELDLDVARSVGEAVHAARLNLVEALRRCGGAR
jgi:hypothetical protein